MNKSWGAMVLLVVMMTLVYFGTVAAKHSDFKKTFGVDVSWFGNPGEGDIIQPLVTKVVVDLNAELELANKKDCSGAEAYCYEQKVESVLLAKKRLDGARDVAKYFGLDSEVPSVPVTEK